MFWKNLSLQELGQGALHTLLRFPFTLLSAFLGVVVCFRLVDLPYSADEEEQKLVKLLIFSWLGLILFFDLELISERYYFRKVKRWLLYAGGLAALVLYFLYLPARLDGDHAFKYILQLLLFGLALHLLASFAPYFNPKTEHGFWQFNEKLFLRFLTATLYTGVLYVGLCIAIAAIKHLFGADINDKIFARLWFFMAGVFHPWFFLAGVPKDLQALETDNHYPKGLKVFTQFVLLPLVTVYLFILYGYLAKILVAWDWPRGWVSYLVLSFSIVGIFSLLLIHPIRHAEGNAWIRTYAKWFYRALFPLLILFALAIWRRVSDYGITEERYFVLALAFWLLVVALYFLFSRQKNIKFIPVTLGLLVFLVAFGPWGAISVSERSQTNRLKYYLEKNGMLSGGKVQPAKGTVPEKDEAQISSILDYLGRVHNYKSLEEMFGKRLEPAQAALPGEPTYTGYETQELMGTLNLHYRHPLTLEASDAQIPFNVETPRQPVIKTTGYDYSFEHEVSGYGNGEDRQQVKVGNEILYIWFSKKDKQLGFEFKNETALLGLQPLLEKYVRTSYYQAKPQDVTFTFRLKNAQLKVLLLSISGQKQNKTHEVNRLTMHVLVKMPLVSGSESAE